MGAHRKTQRSQEAIIGDLLHLPLPDEDGGVPILRCPDCLLLLDFAPNSNLFVCPECGSAPPEGDSVLKE